MITLEIYYTEYVDLYTDTMSVDFEVVTDVIKYFYHNNKLIIITGFNNKIELYIPEFNNKIKSLVESKN